ncbi:hypothetical protein N9Y63_07225 [Akkermansiaceae bacterium]|nr:hypothetical protein [Akkermansiaceae bacterium]MDB4619030.1 hypothetical protein [bacterium]MDC0283103.1 hypothetical protein [bacterium]
MFSFFKKKPRSALDAAALTIQNTDLNNPSVKDLCFGGVFAPAIAFFEDLKDEKDLPRDYYSDGVFFDWVTYLIFRVDFFCFTEKPSSRDFIVNVLYSCADDIFSKAMAISGEDVAELIDDRMAFYGSLAKTGADIQVAQTAVLRCFHDTANNKGIPRSGISRRFEPASAFDEFYIQKVLFNWHAKSLSLIHSLFRDIIDA